MFDPAVLGTLLIGLNAERAEAQGDRRRRPVTTPRRERARLRTAVARGLRRAAALLEQPAGGEVATSPRS